MLSPSSRMARLWWWVFRNGSSHGFAVVRYNVDGSLDTTFNATGIVTTSTWQLRFPLMLSPSSRMARLW